MEEDEPQEPGVKTSVLIVSYNCWDALRACLRNLEASEDREQIEILVVDCGSVDESAQADSEFPAVTILRLPRHFGMTKARNIGARTAKGEFLLFLEPEVDVAPDTIPNLVAALEANPAAVAVCPLLVDPNGNVLTHAGALPTPSELCDLWSEGEPWAAQIPASEVPQGDLNAGTVEVECPDPRAVLARMRAVKGMNYFDERYGHFGSNLEFAAQALRANRKILMLPGSKVIVRGDEGLWQPESASAEADLTGDFGTGVIAYAGKHFGWSAALKVRLRMLAKSLFRFDLGVLNRLLSGAKIDGSQQGL